VIEAAAPPEPAYAFTHALVRETLYAALSGPRRQRLHGRVASVLEAQHGLDPGPSLVEIAYHLCEAAPVGADAGRTIELAEQAAEWELGRDAYEQSVLLLTRALTLVPPEDRERARRLTLARAIAFQRLSHAAFDLTPADD
jgi:predicted ATPase